MEKYYLVYYPAFFWSSPAIEVFDNEHEAYEAAKTLLAEDAHVYSAKEYERLFCR